MRKLVAKLSKQNKVRNCETKYKLKINYKTTATTIKKKHNFRDKILMKNSSSNKYKKKK